MRCPICAIDLVMAERQGVEIDYCPKCRGVWLDRGELDKIIEKSTPSASEAPSAVDRRPPVYREDSHSSHNEHNNYNNQYGGHKKKGVLGELFDF